MAVNDFNLIAPFYDGIVRFVFGRKLIEIQQVHLSVIQPNHRVLILGGGTGKILYHILECTEIDFLDKSRSMINLARKNTFYNPVNFLAEDFLTFQTTKNYDVVICPFFLDCFDEENLKKVLQRIKSVLEPEGSLIVIDFEVQNQKKLLQRVMHVFFKLFTKLESGRLKNLHDYAVSSGFRLTDEKFSHQNQLFSRLYRNL